MNIIEVDVKIKAAGVDTKVDVNIKIADGNIGADVNVKGDHGRTAMMIACNKSRPSSVTALIKAGAEVNTTFLANVARELILLQDTKGKKVIMGSQFAPARGDFLTAISPTVYLFMQISGGKLRLVTARKSPLVFVFVTSGCKRIPSSPK